MKLFRDIIPPHPGHLFAKYVMPSLDLTPAELARSLGLTKASVSYFLSGQRSLTVRTAIRLEKFFDIPAEDWLAIQVRYDAAVARIQEAEYLGEMKEYHGARPSLVEIESMQKLEAQPTTL